MEPDAPLDFALFQLSPRRSRCELVVSGNGRTERIASGSVKPFVAHLRAAEEQAAAQPPPPAIRLQLDRRAAWFSKGTLERFVRFVSTPEVLEMANTFDAEMSQLEGARKIYAQGVAGGADGAGMHDNVYSVLLKELLRAIDVRLSALKQDLVTACARASSAGFNPDSVSELVLFADHFGANRLSEACNKFMSLCQRRPDICPHYSVSSTSSQWKSFDDGNVRGSSSSDMSLDETQADQGASSNKSIIGGSVSHIHRSNSQNSVDVPPEPSAVQHPKPTIQQSVEKQEKETDALPAPAPAGGGSRRLSVQDRINMFESKQKEQTSSSGNSAACTSKVVPTKGEHRRVPSGASMDKLVRRWSNVSDMSIDLSNNDSSSLNEKREIGTPVGTPTSANLEVNSKARADGDANGLKHAVTSCQKDTSDALPLDSTTADAFSSSTLNTTSPSPLSAIASSSPQKQTAPRVEDDMVITSSIESESSFRKEVGASQGKGDVRMSGQAVSSVSTRARVKTSPRPTWPENNVTLSSPPLSQEHVQMTDEETIPIVHEVAVKKEQIVQKDNRGSRLRSKEIHAEADVVGRKDRPSRTTGKISDTRTRATSNPRANFRGSSVRDEAASTEAEVHDVNLQRKSLARKVEDSGRKVAAGSEILPQSDCSIHQGTNLSRQSSSAEQELSLHGGKVKLISDGNAVPLEQTKRPTKGSQDRHDELQKKANELEKLFAAQKLTSSRRGKSTDVQVENTPRVNEVKPPLVLPERIYTKQIVKESITNEFDANELLKMVDTEGYNNNVPQSIISLEESRGKFYDQYMQKRDAKLKEDWKLQGEQKEATIKAMRDSLERSNAEMRAKFSRSSSVPDSTYISRCAHKFPPLQSVIKDKDQGIDSFLVEEEMNSDYLSGDGSSRSADSRKHFSNKVACNQKKSIAPVHRHSSRTVSSGYANRRNLPDNPLAQSVPNFADLRKENTKPSAGLSRAAPRTQPKSFIRSKSIIEESKNISKDQSRKSQSMRKNLSPGELRDATSMNDVIYNWAPSKISNDQVEGVFAYITHTAGSTKSFLRKGNEAHPAVGIAGFAPPMFANTYQNGDDDDFLDQEEDSPDETKDEEYESIEENLRESDFPADSDSENPGISHEFGNSDDPGSENGDVSFPSDAPTLGGSKFNAFAGNMHDTPGEVPASWSTRPHLFAYANDNSDGDAFADSPNGSPSPWNSHTLDQITDADVSRMRKKWGSAQMPFVGPNASQQPRKDVTKGFKKLLKFGRKTRGADGLNDWVSASTASECDDDMEDGRDLAMGSSDDFRKSRMGYPSAYDGFVDTDVFAEQDQSLRSSIPNPPANFRLREDQLTGSSLKAPRSFFSLSTFRSKGGDARLR
uniref:COP1-interacting protein 7 (CIP7)-like n=2 Tax=Oryza sativa subsp. japonica TaxID=39947 RepID=Q8GRM2_ORYSJ|nr:COP1-interacting protein 7 (CIP7)-like [Oryza sativa Japonica Group]BAC21482.1 COP1-interacting protein 7 (CIP7)-like [Oryza sativa Japonica Group]